MKNDDYYDIVDILLRLGSDIAVISAILAFTFSLAQPLPVAFFVALAFLAFGVLLAMGAIIAAIAGPDKIEIGAEVK